MSGRVLRRDSVDSGMACTVFGEAGQAVRFEDGKGNRREFAYDELLRPVALHESGPQQSRVCSERYTYGSAAVELAPHNLCGRLQRHDDTAGSRCIRGYALGGGISHESRRFSLRPEWPDWPLAVEEREALLEPASASSAWRYGPLGEVLVFTDAGGNQQETGLNLAGESKQIKVRLKDGAVHGLLVGARYNAFGRMEQETLGNGVCLQRRYREEDGRLQYLSARRANGEILQDLHYDYDPVGNVLSLEDLARPLLHFANQRIEARCEYTYDSLYQLIEATGWEAGAAGRGPGALPDPRALSNYRQTYDYDAGGNLLDLVHTGAQAHGRTLVAAKHANRCLPANEDFDAGFDANGNLLQLQPGQALAWNLRNELHEVRPVTRQGGPDDWERYLYDGAGQRLRKFASAQAAKRTLIREARYLPGLEQHEKTAERLQVVVVQAGTCSVRILDWQAGRPDEVPQQQIRYALADHLGSSSLELDDQAALLSHEVFHPFGSTAWWAGRNETEAGYKTVRYSGKEQDATGLYYYGARYYRTDWQRWLNPDPAGEVDGLNLYCFVSSGPVTFVDFQGLEKCPIEAIQSAGIKSRLLKGEYLEAQREARMGAIKDLAVINKWIVSLTSSIDFQSLSLLDNRLNNSLYLAASAVPGVEFVVKKMQSSERPQREELAYLVSERIGFHVVPPAKAKAKSLIQQRVQNLKTTRQSERSLCARERFFYYLINEFDDNSGNQLWDETGRVQLIDHEAAFSTRKNAVYNLSTVDLAEVFDGPSWAVFKAMKTAEWRELLGGDNPKISTPEVKALLERVKAVKVAMQQKIDKGEVDFGQKRSFLQKVARKRTA